MYAEGEGVPKDDVQAYVWSSLASAQGYKDAKKFRERVAKAMART